MFPSRALASGFPELALLFRDTPVAENAGRDQRPALPGTVVYRPLNLLPSRYTAWHPMQVGPTLAMAAFWSSMVVAADVALDAALAASANDTASSLPLDFQNATIWSKAVAMSFALAATVAES